MQPLISTTKEVHYMKSEYKKLRNLLEDLDDWVMKINADFEPDRREIQEVRKKEREINQELESLKNSGKLSSGKVEEMSAVVALIRGRNGRSPALLEALKKQVEKL